MDRNFVLVLVFGFAIIFCCGSVYYGYLTRTPSWATAGATISLVMITAYYAYQTNKQVELIEKERKSRVITDFSKNYISKLKEELYFLQNDLNENSYICDDEEVGLKICRVAVRMSTFNNMLDRSHTIKEKVFNKHWQNVRKLLLNLKSDLENLEESIEDLVRHFLQKTEFVDFIEGLIEEYGDEKLSREFSEKRIKLIGRILYGLLLDRDELPFTNINNFWKNYKDRINSEYSKIKPEIEVKIELWLSNRNKSLKSIEKLEKELDKLLREWREEYDLTEEDLGLTGRTVII